MTKEEALQWLTNEKWKNANNKYKKEWNEAFDMAIEALSADALLKQDIDFHKEVSRIEAEKVVDLEHKLADMVSVVRCKDCRWYEPKYKDKEYDCPQGLYAVYADDYCSHAERREP